MIDIINMRYKVTLNKDLSSDVLNIMNKKYNNNYSGVKIRGESFKVFCTEGYNFSSNGSQKIPEYITVNNDRQNFHLFCLLGKDSDYFTIEPIPNWDLKCPKCGETKCSFIKNIYHDYDDGCQYHIMDLTINYICGHSRTIKFED